MKRKYRIGLHLLIWLLIFLNRFLQNYLSNSFSSYANHSDGLSLFTNYFIIELGYVSMNVITFYVAAKIIAPLIFKSRKWIKAILFTLLFFAFLPAYRYLLEYKLFLPHLGFDNYRGNHPEPFWYIKNLILYAIYSYFLYGFIYFIIADWYENSRNQKELEKEKIIAELAFLKSQINPHFLFNTLNDIYSLTYHQSKEAPNAVLKLSELLRYMLKESDEKLAALSKEITYLKNVIELQRIGQKGIAHVDFEIDGRIDAQQIAPLILINFVENAFKHGIFNDPRFPIKIKLSITNEYLYFMVKNRKNDDIKDRGTGIGLKNVSRRLSLIYPEKHTLKITDEITDFTIELHIKWI
jgi:two-component system LytT family sensor kinase